MGITNAGERARTREAAPPSAARRENEYTELARTVQAAGLMRRRYGYYWAKLIAVPVVLAACIVVLVLVGDSWWQLAVAAAFAIVFTQIAFLGHDAAHRQIFRSGKWNDWMSLIIGNLFVGMSYGWWKHKHTRHHGNPNKIGTDPDIDLPAIAFTPDQVTRRSTPLGRWAAAHQGSFFFPILTLEGIALHVSSIQRVMSRDHLERRWAETLFMGVRLVGFPALVFFVLPPGIALAFFGVELGLFGLYMSLSFAPNHKGMPLVPAGVKLDFLRRQVMMSRNIRGGWMVDVAMGGLNYQVEHHLFPSMPRPHLHKAAPMIAAYCREHDVPYTETTLWQSYAIVYRYIQRVGLGERDPFECPLLVARATSSIEAEL